MPSLGALQTKIRFMGCARKLNTWDLFIVVENLIEVNLELTKRIEELEKKIKTGN